MVPRRWGQSPPMRSTSASFAIGSAKRTAVSLSRARLGHARRARLASEQERQIQPGAPFPDGRSFVPSFRVVRSRPTGLSEGAGTRAQFGRWGTGREGSAMIDALRA